MIKKQFTLYLENKPGELAGITRKLADAGVNLEGISVSESTDVGLIQIVAGDDSAAEKVFRDTRVSYTVQKVVLCALGNKPGALSSVLAELAESGVNINYVYATSSDCECECRCNVVISAPDLAKVEEHCG
ncbi:MAG: ACT domain-containing protein [Kiritimatiellia bacterium]